MGKELKYIMSRQIIECSSPPLRTREDAILLILNTIRMFDISKFLSDERKEKVVISINKMNRIFYILEGKMFSMQFPFCVEKSEEDEEIRIYEKFTGLEITPRVLSVLIEAFEKLKREDVDFDTVFEIMMESQAYADEFTSKNMWLLISHLLKYDLGYLRYDRDPENESGKMHPLNHLDICLDTSATYKIGLSKEIEFTDFRNILDITTECAYIS